MDTKRYKEQRKIMEANRRLNKLCPRCGRLATENKIQCRVCRSRTASYLKDPEKNERHKVLMYKWWLKNKVRLSKYRREHYKSRRILCLEHYGSKCNCCGEAELSFLVIDHVNNDGRKHRKEIRNNRIHPWLIRNNFPEGFQVLCQNCNWGKHVNGGVCPHKSKPRKVVKS